VHKDDGNILKISPQSNLPFESYRENNSSIGDYPKMLDEQPKVLKKADPIGKRGQKVMYYLGNVERGSPTSLSSLIHSIYPKFSFNFHSSMH